MQKVTVALDHKAQSTYYFIALQKVVVAIDSQCFSIANTKLNRNQMLNKNQSGRKTMRNVCCFDGIRNLLNKV